MKKITQFTTYMLIIFVIIIIITILIISIPSIPPFTPTTTTIIDCNTMNPNYCNANEDCICSMEKCFRGNKYYTENCVQKAESCSMNFCFFAPDEGMVCVDNSCQIGKK